MVKRVLILLMIGCAFAQNSMAQVAKLENFDAFYNKFNFDKGFQLIRVQFPFKVVAIDEDEKSTVKIISKVKWKYYNWMAQKDGIIKKEKVSVLKIIVHYSVQDTGVGVDYIFEQKAGKWWLVSAKDYSD